jgi:serine/threonine protein kinase
LKNENDWSPEFVDFINFCLNKCPKSRPTADEVLKHNSAFFSKVKDNSYVAENLLKGVPTLQERVSKKFKPVRKL